MKKRKYKNREDIREYFTGCIDENTKIDKESGMIWGVCTFRPESLNNRVYKKKAVESIKNLMDGCKCFMDHGSLFSGQTMENLTGILHKPRKANGGIYADLEVLQNAKCRDLLFEMAESHPSSTGFSISARGKFSDDKDEEGREQVEDILNLWSTDWVDNPATTSGMFEEIQDESKNNNGGENIMDKILTFLEGKVQVRGLTDEGQSQAVINYIEGLEETNDSNSESITAFSAEITELKAKNDGVTKELGSTKDELITAQSKLKNYEDAETASAAKTKRKELIKKVLAEEKLDADKCSKPWMDNLMEISSEKAEEKIRELVKDRKNHLSSNMDNGEEQPPEKKEKESKKPTKEEARKKLQEALSY